jgi:hypothetical protein
VALHELLHLNGAQAVQDDEAQERAARQIGARLALQSRRG